MIMENIPKKTQKPSSRIGDPQVSIGSIFFFSFRVGLLGTCFEDDMFV